MTLILQVFSYTFFFIFTSFTIVKIRDFLHLTQKIQMICMKFTFNQVFALLVTHIYRNINKNQKINGLFKGGGMVIFLKNFHLHFYHCIRWFIPSTVFCENLKLIRAKLTKIQTFQLTHLHTVFQRLPHTKEAEESQKGRILRRQRLKDALDIFLNDL